MIFWIGRGNDLKTKYIPLIVGLNETLPFHGKSVNISKINRNGNDIFVVNFKISNQIKLISQNSHHYSLQAKRAPKVPKKPEKANKTNKLRIF